MREARQAKPPLQLQVAHPPEWLPEAHTSADLGSYAVMILEAYGPCEELFTDAFVVRAFWISLSSSQTRRRHLDRNECQGWPTFTYSSCSASITISFLRLTHIVGQAETWGAS